MNNKYRYSLESGSKKSICPACTKKRFVRYVDNTTGDYLPIRFGRCDRESNCSYALNPSSERYGFENNFVNSKPIFRTTKHQLAEKKIYFIPKETLEQTYGAYQENVFIDNLLHNVPFPFKVNDVENVISLYHLGTIKRGYRKGGITFPFIDIDLNIRTIQVKEFDVFNKTKGFADFLHSMIYKHFKKRGEIVPEWLSQYRSNDKMVSCLFGEHLLRRYPNNPIALVEAPKTAIYGALYYGAPSNPNNYLWLAVYNLSSLNFEKCKSLQSRDVYLFPDLSHDGKSFELWMKNSSEIQERLPNSRFIVSDILEKGATQEERSDGLDLADFLIKQDWRKFRVNQAEVQKQSQSLISVKSDKSEGLKTSYFFDNKIKKVYYSLHFYTNFTDINHQGDSNKLNWDVNKLKGFYDSVTLPSDPIKLGAYTINNVDVFVKSHISIVESNNGNETYKPYLNRLIQLKRILGEGVSNI